MGTRKRLERRGNEYEHDTRDNGMRRRQTDQPNTADITFPEIPAGDYGTVVGAIVNGLAFDFREIEADQIRIKCNNCKRVVDVAIVRNDEGFFISIAHQCPQRP